MRTYRISRWARSKIKVNIKACLIFILILEIVHLLWTSRRKSELVHPPGHQNALFEFNFSNNEQLIEEIESVPRMKKNKTLYKYLSHFKYFKCFETDKAREKELCELPSLNIWNAKFEKLLQPKPVYNKCRKNKPLSYIKDNSLLIDDLVKAHIYTGNISVCQFAPVIRSAISKDDYILGEFRNFDSGLPMIDDCVKVRCFDNNNTVVYEYVHYIFHPIRKGKDDPSQKLNVLILIFDSVSASSFERSLPKTFRFLKSFDNFFHFTKHHTVGQNTLPNLVPMLAGKSSKELLGNAVFPPPLDDFPFIWKNFSSSNYVTYLNEDWRNSMFNNDKFGFRQSPTDFYMRPFWLAAYDSLSSARTKMNSNPKPCFYNKLYHQLSFDWLRAFQNIYSNSSQGTFGIIKSNEMSHDYLERLFWVDNDLKELLKDLLTEAFLNKTLLFVMGDHGHRFHPIRHTFNGKVEEKLPFFSMMVPKILLKNNPFLKSVLKVNSQTLTTFYDVYETLLHLLVDQTNIEPSQSSYFSSKLKRSSSGFSLFLPLPYRNCTQAHIPEFLCSCRANATIELSATDLKVINQAAQFLVRHINEVLLADYKDICVPLQLKRISDAEVVDSKLAKYSVIFETIPNGAIFDGMVVRKNVTDNFELVGLISRVNLYGSTSKCMQSYFLKNYCYCRSFIKEKAKIENNVTASD